MGVGVVMNGEGNEGGSGVGVGVVMNGEGKEGVAQFEDDEKKRKKKLCVFLWGSIICRDYYRKDCQNKEKKI